MKCLNIQNYLPKALIAGSIIFSLVLIGGCSGGGSPPPALDYTGATTPVTLDENNAYDMLVGAYQGGEIAESLNFVGAAQAPVPETIESPRMLQWAAFFEMVVSDINFSAMGSAPYVGAIISENDTLYGSCGGSLYYDVGLDSLLGDFSGTANFQDYCEEGSEQVIMNGLAEFYGSFGFSLEIDSFTVNYYDLATETGSTSYSLTGYLHANLAASPIVLTTSTTMTDNTTGKMYWLQNFVIKVYQGIDFLDITTTGRYYDHDNGYVDVSTDKPLRIFDQDDVPSSGILVLTGGKGSAGGNTMARLVAVDSSSFTVEADTDGDGLYDDLEPETYYWSNI
jgi:hypothetical protein